MSGAAYPRDWSYYDQLLSQVSQEPNADLNSLQSAMAKWQFLGSLVCSVLRGAGETDNFSQSDPLMPDSLGTVVQAHLGGWHGVAADEFLKQVNLVTAFGNDVGLTMYDKFGENTGGEYPESNTFHRGLSDLHDALQLILEQHPKINNAFDAWANAIATNICNYNLDNDLNANIPSGWPKIGYDPPYYDSSNPYATSSNGNVVFVLHYAGDPDMPITLPGSGYVEPGSSSWGVNPGQNVKALKDQIKGNFTTYYKSQVGPLADLITSPNGTYVQVAKQLPTKVDDSYLPKGKPKSTNGGGGGGPFGSGGPYGGFGSGSGTGVGPLGSGSGGAGGGAPGTGSGGLPGGGAPGTGSGSLPGGGAPGGGSGSIGGGGGGAPGGGFGSVGGGSGSPTHLAGLGGGGLPGGGFGGGGGGLPGGLGGLAGGGGPGGLGSGGAAGAAANEAAVAAHGEVPLMPPMMPPMMNQNQDNNRQRKSWLPEDEDLWGGAVDAVPPVISSDG